MTLMGWLGFYDGLMIFRCWWRDSFFFDMKSCMKVGVLNVVHGRMRI